MKIGDITAKQASAIIPGIIAALELLMRKRDECVYRGRGWNTLNNACHHVKEGFWAEVKS